MCVRWHFCKIKTARAGKTGNSQNVLFDSVQDVRFAGSVELRRNEGSCAEVLRYSR